MYLVNKTNLMPVVSQINVVFFFLKNKINQHYCYPKATFA